MLKRFKDNISKFALIEMNDSILVALSGGPDSVCLLMLLNNIKKQYRLKLFPIYINHMIRPEAAKKEIKFCRQLCKTLNLHLTIQVVNIPEIAKLEKISLEDAGRRFRYKIFSEILSEEKIDKIALGHHADDNAETVLFRIFRGTGIKGLRGIPAKRGKIIRPLISFRKSDIFDFLKKNKLSFCKDQSNKSSEFTRNYIRNELLPEIRKRINPEVVSALINLSETAAEEDEYLASLTEKEIKRCLSITPGRKFEINLNKFNSLPGWQKKRVIRFCLRELSDRKSFPDRQTVERILDLIISPKSSISLPYKQRAELSQQSLFLFSDRKIEFNLELIINKRSQLKELDIWLKASQIKYLPNKSSFKRMSREVFLDYNKVIFPLLIRNSKPGDKFKPLGSSGNRKLSDYLIDKKLPRALRNEILLVCDLKGIIWLSGFEIANRVKIDKLTKKVLKIEFDKRRHKKTAV